MKTFRPIVMLCTLLLLIASLSAAESQTGKVLESFDAAGYSYLRLDQNGQEVWLATQPVAVSAGDEVEYSGGNEMRDFYSKSLDRTFDSILFVDSVRVPGQEDASIATKEASSAGGQAPHGMMGNRPVAAPVPGEIQRIEGGKTVAEIFADREQLEGTEVILRARVMKSSANILGKNWITLQDGTGTEPDTKLLATSAELPAPGDLLTARGIVQIDIDLGSGYQYKVLLEEVTFIQ